MNSIITKTFSSKEVGDLKNRIVMSPMTRGFADLNHCCTDKMSEYYERRAKDGVALIITEGIIVHPSGDGYNNVPHMWNDSHVESWKKTVSKVHATESKIYAQIWHCGRISHSDYTGGQPPISSTNVRATGMNRQNNKEFGVPKAIIKDEIPEIFALFINSIEKALSAGFDGVQLHFGNGYLVDQFFDDRVNDRTDEYGGSVENRCRFALELLKEVIAKFGSEKIMIRISPSRFMGKLYNWNNLDEMIEYLIPELDKIGLRQLDVTNANANYFETSKPVIQKIRKLWPHFLMGGASLSHTQAITEIEEGNLDMITWGRYILANPNFVSKLKNDEELLEMTNEMRGILH